MVCGFGSAEAVQVCVSEWYPFISAVAAVISILAVLYNGGATTWLSYAYRNARAHEEERDNARLELDVARKELAEEKLRYQHWAKEFSKPLQIFQEQVIKEQAAVAEAAQARKRVEELEGALQVLRAPPQGNESLIKQALSQAESRIVELERRVSSVRGAYNLEADAFWSRPVTAEAAALSASLGKSIPIVLFANQKGGVGKTTLSANLAAFFARKLGERVLVVDLDYQGSLSTMLEREAGSGQTSFRSTVDLLFQTELPKNWQELTIKQLDRRIHYVPCYYSFEKVERSLEYAWLVGDEIADARFRLARCLLSPNIQENYDRVIIDAPPRFTTGFINGFCAATHLFVPTIVDDPSLNAVGNFIVQFSKLRIVVNPSLELSGIIGMRTTNVQGHSLPATLQERADIADIAAQQALSTKKPYFIRDAVIKNLPRLADATTEGIPYIREEATQPMFDNLGRKVAQVAPRKRRDDSQGKKSA